MSTFHLPKVTARDYPESPVTPPRERKFKVPDWVWVLVALFVISSVIWTIGHPVPSCPAGQHLAADEFNKAITFCAYNQP